jgi:four helix bundle protein
MKYERFEDLPCWKAAMELATRVYVLTRDRFFGQPGDLRDQMRRAALSVSNNIAEGFERGTTAELLAFLYIARGSAGEVRSMLHFVERLAEAGDVKSQSSDLKSQISDSRSRSSDFKSQISDLRALAESCSRQIRGWADSLQNSEIKGQRHLDARTRAGYEQKKRAAAFRRRVAESLHEAHPEMFPAPDDGS